MENKQELDVNVLTEISNNIKTLALDAITNANSGHPGIVLSSANILTALFYNHLNVDPFNLNMFNRDRFILGAGHGSALLYATMLVFQYSSLHMDDLRKFRQLNSKTPGHPENHLAGVDYTTGPLGQASAAAVGFAIAETHIASLYNQYVNNLVNHYTYCLITDGCFEEGVNYEALSLAGKYKLNKLIFLYDSNKVQLDGFVAANTITNKEQYFTSLGLNYIYVEDGFDFNAINDAINLAKQSKDKASIIEFNTIIGKDTVYENTNKAHGTALTKEQLLDYKNKIEWRYPEFTLLQNVTYHTNVFVKRGKQASLDFQNNLKLLYKTNPNWFHEFNKIVSMDFEFDYTNYKDIIKNIMLVKQHSTRELAEIVLQDILIKNPTWMLTNPDISSSTKIRRINQESYSSEYLNGQNIPVGVREFAALAIANGISAHKGAKGLSSCFLVFSDYNKAALRIAALSHLPIINFYSHDSILVGEDGATHEPIEQLWTLRSIPNHNVFRPHNIDELITAFKWALLAKQTPTTIVTSRQKFDNYYSGNLENIAKGGYVFEDDGDVQIILISSGSEISVAKQVKAILQQEYKLGIRIVSMLSTYLFDQQPDTYKNSVLNLNKKYIFSLEWGSTLGWYKYCDHPFGIDDFGYSGKDNDIINYLKLDPHSIADKIIKILNNQLSDFAKLKA